MALSATVIPQIEDALKSLCMIHWLKEVWSTVVIYTWLLRYVILKGQKDQNNLFHWTLEILITLLILIVKDLIVGECSIIHTVMWVLLC